MLYKANLEIEPFSFGCLVF